MKKYIYWPRLPRFPRVPRMSKRRYIDNNIGCKEIILNWLSMIMWVLVVSAALMGFAIDVWVGVAFIIIVVVTHIIVAIVAKKREQVASHKQHIDPFASLREAIHHEDIEKAKETSQIIPKDYYNQVAKVADDVFADYQKILKLQNIDNLVDTMGVKFVMNGRPIVNVKDKIRLLFWVDITRCYTGLGHLIDLDSKEGLGLLYLIALSNGCTDTSYSKFAVMKGVYQSEAEAVLKGVKAYIDGAQTISEVFFLSRLLASSATALHRKFLVDMYRFASITAKADKTVTDEEAEWLSSILKLQSGGNHEFVPQEDEEEQELTPISAPHIPRLDPIFADVARWIVANQEGSTSKIQRQFEIGYNRAGKLSDQLEAAGIVGPNKGTEGREVLIKDKVYLERLLKGIMGEDYTKAEGDTMPKDTIKPTSKPKTQNPAKMLDELIGLDSVKKEVETLSNFIKIQQTRAAKGLKTSAVSYHCVFTGNPGTGKTTVARILAKIYKNLGVVSKGHLVETDRAGLVAEYVGQTAVKTNKIIDSALDGVLFIDEAYSLIGGGESDYGKEAIATLLKRMEDNRDRLIVILAGYTKNMKDFIDSNPGLQSRFNRYIEFPDYSAEELLQIFEANMKKYEYHFGEGAKEALQQYFANEVANKDANFGNGRLVRNVFEKTLERQANRLAHEVNLTTDKLSQIEIEDFPIK